MPRNENVIRDPLLWMWLSLAIPPGTGGADVLLARFEYDVDAIYNTTRDEIADIPKIDEKTLDALCNKSLKEAEYIFGWCAANNVGILPYDSPIYPSRLRSLIKPPVVLYYRGRFPSIDDNVCIATVGTRRISEYGRRNAYSFGYDLARGGAIVVSGMARGVDSVCHRGALDAGGHTIAVLGCGIDRVYPPENDALMAEIGQRGTLITEFRPFSEPSSFHFPIRNRIISGLCLGTVVIEADDRSGAMITARTARDQGRDVFSVPGKVGEQNALGTNILIREGAIPALCAENILVEYASLFPHRIFIERILARTYRPGPSNSPVAGYSASGGGRMNPPRGRRPQTEPQTQSSMDSSREIVSTEVKKSRPPSAVPTAPRTAAIKPTPSRPPERRAETEVESSSPPIKKLTVKQLGAVAALNETQAKVYNALPDGKPIIADELTATVDLPMNKIMTALTMLELKGLVKSEVGGLFGKKYE